MNDNLVGPHSFRSRKNRPWICNECYAPRSMHPRMNWVNARPKNNNKYLSKNSPHFKEGW